MLDPQSLSSGAATGAVQGANVVVNFINNGYSSAENLAMNNNIGVMQVASRALGEVLGDNNMPNREVVSRLENTRFLNEPVFSNQVLMDTSGNTIFDPSRISGLLENQRSDTTALDSSSFRQALQSEQNTITDSLNTVRERVAFEASNGTQQADKDFLTANANLFMRAHDTAALAMKLDSLLL